MGLDVERLLARAVRIFRIRRRRNPHDLCAAAHPREARAGRNPPCCGCRQSAGQRKAGHCSLFCPTSPGVYTLDAIAVAKALKKVFPQEDISLIGADVCYVHRIKARGKDFLRPVRTAAALLILLLGSALGLTWFHADVNMPQAQADVYAAITGAPPDDVRLITIPYCVGVALGVCVFYAIPFPHQTTPLEVKLTEYQEDMEKAEGKPIE